MGLLVNGHYVRIASVNFAFTSGSPSIEARLELDVPPAGSESIPLYVTIPTSAIADRAALYPQLKNILEKHGFTVVDA
jgi:hypothetical protein